jgi:hypothetical protein
MKDETTIAFHNTGRRSLLRPVRGLLSPRPESPDLPDRYRVREEQGERYLACLDAPEIRVVVSRSTAAAGSAARKAPEGTIFLDGAAQSEPFIDAQRRVMNLDHHQGCVRPFTLATCEQALALVLRGLDLREKPWTIHANDADLDIVLAIWVLLNGPHLEPGGSVLQAVAPVIRLEGVIDAHGSELRELTGFPPAQLRPRRSSSTSSTRPSATPSAAASGPRSICCSSSPASSTPSIDSSSPPASSRASPTSKK